MHVHACSRVVALSRFVLQTGKEASLYDKERSRRNTDPPRVTIIHHIQNP